MSQPERKLDAIDDRPTDLAVAISPDDHSLGPDDAPVTLVEYGEFECPHCGRAHFQLKALRESLPDLGVRFVFRHLARDEVHPFAVRAAVASEAADVQGHFWDMHDHLFEHQHALEYDDLKQHAREVGLDVDRFLEDFRNPSLLEKVQRQGAEAVRSGVTGTPTFFLNGALYEGGYDRESLVAAISGKGSQKRP